MKPHWLDWETHQINRNTEIRFNLQWRATPSGSFMPVDYKGGEHSNLITRSFIASPVRLLYKQKGNRKISWINVKT